MARRIGIIVAWLAATALAVLIASAAVASVRSQVTDEPTALGSPDAQALTAGVTSPQPDPAGSSTTASNSAATIPDSTTTSAAGDTSDDDPDASSTSTSAASTSTTTTTASPAAPESFKKTYDTDAGSVRIVVEGRSVTFGGAFPLPGWRVELEDGGPEKVKVHFEANDEDGEIQFVARFDGDELAVSITTGDDD